MTRAGHSTRPARIGRRFGCTAGLLALLLASAVFSACPAPAGAAEPAPAWNVVASPYPTNFSPSGQGSILLGPAYWVVATNVGGAPTSGLYTLTARLPAGLTPAAEGAAGTSSTGGGSAGRALSCTSAARSVTCTGTEPVAPGSFVFVKVPVDVAVGAPPNLTAEVTISGGSAVAASALAPTSIAPSLAPFGFLSGSSGLYGVATGPDGALASQAGSHPEQLTVGMSFPSYIAEWGIEPTLLADDHVKDVAVDLPRGVVVDPTATPRCTGFPICPAASQVGVAMITTPGIGLGPTTTPVFNVAPAPGAPASLAFEVLGVEVHLRGGVRTGGDYGLFASSRDILAKTAYAINGAQVTLWGDPSAASHDSQRGECFSQNGSCPAERAVTHPAFLTMPSACSGPLPISARADSWEAPGVTTSAAALLGAGAPGGAAGVTGCGALDFTPTLRLRPDVSSADSPTGLSVDLHVPQREDFEGLAEANLKDAKVSLPPGLVVSPSAAAGLGACTEAQIELHGSEPASCPEASKIGTVEVDTPLLDHPLPGAIYVAQPHANPFGSLLAIYVAVHDPETGVVVKLAGHVVPDPRTGQLTTTFSENPELPFEDFKLDFFGGPTAALATPQTCGTFETTSDLTPWSAPQGEDARPADSFAITRGADGSACASSEAAAPDAPAFEAGSAFTGAGEYSPFVLHLRRADGTQRLKALNLTLPPGLTGKLAGVPYCPDAALEAASTETGKDEQASPSCPAASEVGTVTVGAGPGERPYYVTGHAYLAGPYEGAPLSLAIVTPAVAGPFDLGTVVVRSALEVNQRTAQISVRSDEIPHILAGIPLDIRSIAVSIDRPEFTRNPTSCEAMAVGGEAVSLAGAAAQLSNRFQVGGCKGLDFKPRLKLRLKGATRRTGHPALRAVVTYPKGGGQANIRRAQVNLPHGEFLDQGNIDKACTKPVLLAGNCPKSSIYGHAKAWTPLLAKPLQGPVYLVGGYGYKLPALVAELNGQIRILLVGKVDSGKNKGIRNTFEVVPDAPVSRFELRMKGGKKYGLLENSENLCKAKKSKRRAIARFVGHNGKARQWKPLVTNACGKAKKRTSSRKRKHHSPHEYEDASQ